jgi:AMP-binding enzyme
VSPTPTYDQLREERVKVTRNADSLLIDHSGKHHLPDDTTPQAAAHDRSPHPNIDLTDDRSGSKTDRGTRHGKHRDDIPAATAATSRSPHQTADPDRGWSWFGPSEPDCSTAHNIVTSMSTPMLLERTHVLLTVLAELGVRPHDPVLIMLPPGPGFTEAFTATFYRDAIPLPINPLLSAPDLAAAATQTHARLVLASPEQLPTLTQLPTPPPILIHGPHGPWAAALRLR